MQLPVSTPLPRPWTSTQCLYPNSRRLDHPHVCSQSKQPFPRQLNLPRRLSCLETPLGNTCHAPLAKLNLILDVWEGAGAVVWEVYAAEGMRAEVLVAVCCQIVSTSLRDHSHRSLGETHRLRTATGTIRSLRACFAVVPVVAVHHRRTSARRIGIARWRASRASDNRAVGKSC